MSGGAAIARTVGVLGHELRNPLAAAVTGTALLREMLDGDDPRRAVADGVADELARIAALIDRYLEFARCGRPQREAVPLARLCAAVAGRATGVTATVAADCAVAGDAVLLERALANLVENALAAGATRVRLGARRCGEAVLLTVDDDGPGVAPEHRGRIFEPGYSRRGSTGLGLGFVAEVATAHRGSVWCEAGDPGARFVLRLPAAAPAPVAQRATQTADLAIA
ncbi:MAG: sensor histidine kinase [Planctomycetota bacterium]